MSDKSTRLKKKKKSEEMEQCRNEAIRQKIMNRTAPKAGTVTNTHTLKTTHNAGLEGQVKHRPKGKKKKKKNPINF